MKHSIKKQFAVVFIGLMVATLGCCWFINTTFLEKYYLNQKKEVIFRVYNEINGAMSDESIKDDAFDIELQKLCGKYNISLLVLDEYFLPLKATMHDSEFLKRQLLDNLFFQEEHAPGEKILEHTDNYVIRRSIDPRMRTEYIEMWGFLDEGNLFLIRTPKEGIIESVSIANRFLTYVGIVAVVVSGLVIWLISKRITEPILELAGISERMKHLDFEAKYKGNHKNEIALLGENINQLSETLEETISELKTANNELQKDVEKKEQIDEMRKDFLANVSHELKTPIALIQGYAEGLKDGISEDAESREFYCDVIVDEAAKMNRMVQKLMTLNQLEFGNDVVTMERFDIADMISTFVGSADILTKQSGISVKMDLPAPAFVWADEFKTEEVFRNYFSNAINHCSGEKVIHVRLAQKDGKTRISVFNTGEPIPEECVPHLWEKFYKVDKARTREYGGSGIGLSIVKAIMDSMNQACGVINYENGVEFWFELESLG